MKNRYYKWCVLGITCMVGISSCITNGKHSGPMPDAGNGGITLPDGFHALVVADDLGRGRHIAVNENGDIYLALEELRNGHGIVGLRDTTGDGKADATAYFGGLPGTGIHIHNGYLYFAHDTGVIRYKLNPSELVPSNAPETIVYGFKKEYQHAAKTIAFDTKGNLYINVGAPSNGCQQEDRTPGSPGMDPCPILENYGGIWQFKADVQNQTQKDGRRFATGLRNCVAIEWNAGVDNLYVVQHGRDQLNQMFPGYYNDEDNADLPAEELFMLEDGDDCGWPYCYYDQEKNLKVLAPEYGGNGDSIGRCAEKKDPLMAFPAHTAPNDLVFYAKDMFPSRFHNGAFIAFHGSWNRSPLEQEGYYVVFVPFEGRVTTGDWEIFADGFAGESPVISPGNAAHRPMGLAVGSDGSLYISDSVKGKVWRVFYE